MSAYLGDFADNARVNFAFTTNAADGGRESTSASLEEADIAIASSDGDGTWTEMTLDASTITITENPGSKVGVYLVSVNMGNDADFTTGKDYVAYFYPDETVDSQSIAGVLAHWSCENRGVNVTQVSGDSTAADNLEAACDNYSVTRGLSGTALPAAAADAAGGLPISDAGGLDLDNNVQNQLVAYKLDHLVLTAESDDPADNSIMAKLVSATGDWSTFVPSTDSLESQQAEHDQTQSDIGSLNDPTAAAIADAVLDEAMAGHVAAGSLGKAVADVLVDTAEIGAAGAGLTEAGGDGDHLTEAGGTGDHLTAIPWNSAWDAEVESEVNDGLVALNLDHLMAVADADDVVDDSALAKLASATADWSTFVSSTDSLEANQAEHDSTQSNIAALNDLDADGVWDEAITEPAGMFAWASATPRKVVATLGVLMRNEINSDSDSVDVRNDADDANLWSYASSDDGTTYISGEAA